MSQNQLNILLIGSHASAFLNIKEIIVRSSNIGTARIAEIIGKENQINFF